MMRWVFVAWAALIIALSVWHMWINKAAEVVAGK